MSRTGISPCEPEVLMNLAIICSFVCFCNLNPSKSKDERPANATPPEKTSGQQTKEIDYRQACVDAMLISYNILNDDSKILVEHPFYVPKFGEPVPLLPMDMWDETLPSLGRMLGTSRLAKAGVPREVIEDYLRNRLTYRMLRDRGTIGDIGPYSAGELSIPDTVIVWNRNYPAHSGNIRGVGEIKFPGDSWDDQQYLNAVRIAGGEENVHTLTPESCLCDGEKQKLEERTGQPALQVAAVKEQELARLQMATNLAELAAAISSFAGRRNPIGLFFSTVLTPSAAW